MGPRPRQPPHPRGQRRRARGLRLHARRTARAHGRRSSSARRACTSARTARRSRSTSPRTRSPSVGHDACVVIAEDVTEKERLRHQLQQSQRLESLGQLAGGVAHDFNNLLAVILGYASFIERRHARPRGRGRSSATSRRSARRASAPAALTRQLLAFARREVVRPTVLDLNGVVLEIEQLLRRTLGEHVELETDARARTCWPILADPGQLEQVLVNLAVNARDAMPDGGTLTIETDERRRRRRVRQRPPGPARRPLRPPAGQRHRHRHDAASRRARVRAVLHHQAQGQGHRASAWPRSTASSPRRAATCRSTPSRAWARRSPSCCPRPTRPAGRAPSSAAARRRRRRRDRSWSSRTSRRCCEVTRRILDGNGYEVLAAGQRPGGAPARRRSTTAAIDVLLTDVVMPQMLGKEVAERVTALRPEIQVLFMSGYAQAVLAPMGDLADGRESSTSRSPRPRCSSACGRCPSTLSDAGVDGARAPIAQVVDLA